MEHQSLKIPRGRISYSMWHLWNTNKPEFRRRYYEGKKSYQSPEILFGKKTAEMLERNEYHHILAKIPAGTHKEYRIETTIEGIPILAFLDSCSPNTGALFETKTSHTLWDQQRVDTHDQLPFYCMCLQAHIGLYDPHVLLTWLETRLVEQSDVISGITFSKRPSVEFTGRIMVFTREVTKSDISDITERVVSAALEIEQDYKIYQKNHP